MTRATIDIQFHAADDVFHSGDTLAGSYRLRGVVGERIQAVEGSVMWHTEGKGDEDMAVHAFWRSSVEAGDWIDPLRAIHFHTTLPSSPLSYDGKTIKIRWCMRVRVFVYGAKEIVAQRPFRLIAREA
jgi:hypothetical protein